MLSDRKLAVATENFDVHGCADAVAGIERGDDDGGYKAGQTLTLNRSHAS